MPASSGPRPSRSWPSARRPPRPHPSAGHWPPPWPAPWPTTAAPTSRRPRGPALRRTVARRPVESLQSTPHFYLTITVDAEALLDLRAELNRQRADRGDDLKVSVNGLSVMAWARLLRTNPDLYVSIGGDRLLRHRRVHVGVAVALDGGLTVPVVRDADTKTLTQVARETRDL